MKIRVLEIRVLHESTPPPQQTLRLPLTAELLLPVHLVEEVLGPQEEVVDLAALLVPLRGVVDSQLGLGRQELADVGHWEHNLLHGAVLTHNLEREKKKRETQTFTDAAVT